MGKDMRLIAALVLSLALSPAAAQSQEATPADTGAGSSTESRLAEMNSILDGLTEQVQTIQTDTDKLKKFKFSGYLQARYNHSEQSSDTVKVEKSPAVITPANQDRFYIRRARLKLTYDAAPLSQAVVYFSAGSIGGDLNVKLLEAYVTLMDPWTPDHRNQLTVGQMNVPFGYELERSSSVRELPERSRAENLLFPGERDRGFKLVTPWTPRLETVVGLFNGGGLLDAAVFGTDDPTRLKDLVGRARWSQGIFDVAGSAYVGQGVVPLTGPDVDYDRTRFGADAQAYYELPRAGGGSLKGEFYTGQNLNPDSLKAFVAAPTNANPVQLLKPGVDTGHFSTSFLGWYVMWVQNLGEKLQVAARYEEWDPNRDAAHDQFKRTSLGVNYFYDGFTRFSLAYDIPRTETASSGGYVDTEDDLWTLQLQLKF